MSDFLQLHGLQHTRLPCPLLSPRVWWLIQSSVCLQCGRPRFNPWVGKILWRRKWQPPPVLLPGKPHGWRSLVGYSPWGHKESDTTERLHHHHQSLLRLMSIESVMPPNRLILRHPVLLLPSIFPSIRVFSKELALSIR